MFKTATNLPINGNQSDFTPRSDCALHTDKHIYDKESKKKIVLNKLSSQIVLAFVNMLKDRTIRKNKQAKLKNKKLQKKVFSS